ncbi:MAG: hypothetical protein Q4A70_01630 [Candidatus Saccharibacteria bacterium]|nr:hypothetical protein [Candidatus Saccharibacteria bacterium]
MFDAAKIVDSIPAEKFKKEFIGRIGRDATFSRLRCGGEDCLEQGDWKKIREMYVELGLDEEMCKQEMLELAYALTRRAVLQKK